MKNHVYYWFGCTNTHEFQEYEHLINKILSGEASVDKMVQYRIYKSRINKKDRLFWTTTLVDGIPHMLILDVILNHDYQKSKFLKKGVLDAYLEKRAQGFLDDDKVMEAMAEETEETEETKETKETEKSFVEAHHKEQAYYYDQAFIIFNDEQNNALQLPMPMVVSGPAGSGKSCVLFELLRNMRNSMPENELKPILYVANSPFLVAHLQQMWNTEADDRRVIFKSYDTLVTSLDSTCRMEMKVDDTHFFKWLDAYIENKSKAKKAKKAKAEEASQAVALFSRDKEAVYQEFQVIAAYAKAGGVFTRENYIAFGARQSLFPTTDEFNPKPLLFDAYLAYKASFHRGKWNPAFHELQRTELYYAIVVDEALDLSMLQLMRLYELTTSGRIAYAIDSHQRSRDRLSHRPLLLEMLARLSSEKPVGHVQLPGSYRCPDAVIKMTNAVISLKYKVTGGIADRHEIGEISFSDNPEREPGEVSWYNPSIDEDIVLKRLFPSTHSAVVTLNEHVAEAVERYPGAIVHTPDSIKGLGYRYIVAFRLLDDKKNQCCLASKTLGERGLDGSASANRAKKGQSNEQFAPVFNAIIIAITRTTHKLYFVQKKTHQLKHIIPTLLESIASSGNPHADIPVAIVDGNTKKDWHEHAVQLLRNGNEEQAAIIFHRELKTSGQEDFEGFKANCLNPYLKKADMKSRVLLKDSNAKNLCDWLGSPDGRKAWRWAVGDCWRTREGLLLESIRNSPQQVRIFCHFLKESKCSKAYPHWTGELALETRLPQGDTAMHLAAAENCAEMMTLFNEKGMKINQCNDNGMTPLFVGIAAGHLAVVKACILGEPLSGRGDNGLNALNHAIICNFKRSHLAIISFILQTLSKETKETAPFLNAQTLVHEHPLIVAATRYDWDVAKMLLQFGANVNIATKDGHEPLLSIASSHGSVSMVNLLLERGAKIDEPSCNGRTALIAAVLNQQLDVVTRLVEKNANMLLWLKDTKEDALEIAIRLENTPIQNILGRALAGSDLLEQRELIRNHILRLIKNEQNWSGSVSELDSQTEDYHRAALVRHQDPVAVANALVILRDTGLLVSLEKTTYRHILLCHQDPVAVANALAILSSEDLLTDDNLEAVATNETPLVLVEALLASVRASEVNALKHVSFFTTPLKQYNRSNSSYPVISDNDVTAALIYLHDACLLIGREAQTNYNAIVTYKNPMAITCALRFLKNAGLLIGEQAQINFNLIVAHSSPVDVAKALVALKNAGLLVDKEGQGQLNRDAIATHDCPLDVANALICLSNAKILTQAARHDVVRSQCPIRNAREQVKISKSNLRDLNLILSKMQKNNLSMFFVMSEAARVNRHAVETHRYSLTIAEILVELSDDEFLLSKEAQANFNAIIAHVSPVDVAEALDEFKKYLLLTNSAAGFDIRPLYILRKNRYLPEPEVLKQDDFKAIVAHAHPIEVARALIKLKNNYLLTGKNAVANRHAVATHRSPMTVVNALIELSTADLLMDKDGPANRRAVVTHLSPMTIVNALIELKKNGLLIGEQAEANRHAVVTHPFPMTIANVLIELKKNGLLIGEQALVYRDAIAAHLNPEALADALIELHYNLNGLSSDEFHATFTVLDRIKVAKQRVDKFLSTRNDHEGKTCHDKHEEEDEEELYCYEDDDSESGEWNPRFG